MIVDAIAWSSAVLMTAVGVELIRRWAVTRRVLDVPNPRSSHTRPVPRGGGIAIDVVVILGLIGVTLLVRAWRVSELIVLIGASVLIAVVSWVDDMRSLPSVLRLSAHLFAAAVVVLAFVPPSSIQIAGPIAFNSIAASIVLTVIWITGLTNAYNFMDGIDGISGAHGVVAGVIWLLVGKATGEPALFWVGLLTSAASLGFLFFNWPPAKIFMGDVGSAFLGFTFAFAALLFARRQGALSFLMIVPVWPFVFDTAFTFLRRLRRGERVFEAHRSHLYQRLVIAGWSHAAVSALYAFLAACGGAVLLSSLVLSARLTLSVAVVGMLGMLLWLLVRIAEKRGMA